MSVLTYQELLGKSDLVVIATPTGKTTDTGEESFLPNIMSQDRDGNQSKVKAIGVETAFTICAVLKGDEAVEHFVLHHYRRASSEMTANGPMLVYFDPSDPNHSSYLMFLTREPDGRYAPTGGQTDPGFNSISRVPFEFVRQK